MAVVLPVLLLLLVLAADVVRWQQISLAVQTATDAAALAGAQEVWVHREIDAGGGVWSQTLYLNEDSARQQAQDVLLRNLRRIEARIGSVTIVRTAAHIDAPNMTVRVEASVTPGAFLAGRFGLVPPQISRVAEARPVLP